MTLDPIRARRELAPKRRLDISAVAVFCLLFAGSLAVYLRETRYMISKIQITQMALR